MHQGNIYRFDPQPVQRGPGVPIPAQGDQPPRTVAGLALGVIIGCWPTGMEPGLPQPNLRYGRIAPLTLAYGDQPPVTSAVRDIDIYSQTYSTAWQPPDPLPTIPQRNYIAPLTLTYGSQPPLTMRDLVNRAATRLAWEPPPPMPVQKGPIAPLTLVYGDNPPVQTGTRDIDFYSQAYVQAWQPPDPQPQLPNRRYVAPQTLVYGDQPPAFSRVNVNTILRSWVPPDPQPVQLTESFVAFAYIPDNPPSGIFGQLNTIIRGWWNPPDPQPWQKGPIAPLTLVYGQQPPPKRMGELPYAPATWDVQTVRQARVSIAPLISVVLAQPPFSQAVTNSIIAAQWQAIPQQAIQRTTIAPLTLRYGDQPPLTMQDLVRRTATRTAWEPPDPQPQTKAAQSFTAPLAIVYGDQPPATAGYRGANFTTVLGSWVPPAPMPTLPFVSTVFDAVATIPPPLPGETGICFRPLIARLEFRPEPGVLDFRPLISRLEFRPTREE